MTPHPAAGVKHGTGATMTWIHRTATAAVAFVWVWHGLVPKLLGPHPDELALLADGGVPQAWVVPLTLAAGWAELALGIVFPFVARRRWPWLLTIALMLLALAGVLATAPERALTSFNPVTLNVPVALLGAIGLLSLRHLPPARAGALPGREERRQ